MHCQNISGINAFQAERISAYLKLKEAKTCKEKEMHASIYIRDNSSKMRKEYCATCPFQCSLTTVNIKNGWC